MEKNDKRIIKEAFVAIALSLIAPGLAHYHFGAPKRAAEIYGASFLFSLIFFLSLYRWFFGFIFSIIFALVFYCLCTGSAIRKGLWFNKIKGVPQKWYMTSALAAIHLMFALPIMLFYISPLKAYQVPTNSMSPTLRPGDIFFVDTRHYKHNIPNRGDVVVFKQDSKPRTYVKRVVGLPNESIRALDEAVFINGKQLHEDYPGVSLPFYDYSQYKLIPVLIPEHKVYLLGDNRSESYDSRYFGSIPLGNLKGLALYIVFSKDRAKIGRALKND